MTSGTLVTIVAATKLSASMLGGVAGQLQRLGVDGVAPEWLEPETAADIHLPNLHPDPNTLQKLAAALRNTEAVDIFIQPDDNSRRKKLLVADMDATIVVGETLDDLAAHLGIADKITPITARAMRGELDFAAALRERVAMFKGMPFSVLEDVAKKIQLVTGAQTLLRTMAAQGARCVLASGGFDFFTAIAAARAGFHANHGNRLLFDDQGRAIGQVGEPVLDKNTKREILLAETARLGISIADSVTIGDGANDLPMLLTAGMGVAYYAKPAVRDQVINQINHTDLTSLLYAQGYSRRMWQG